MPNQYIIALFQPFEGSWCADVYLPNAVGEKGERIHCGKGYAWATKAVDEAGQFITAHRTNALLSAVTF